MLREAGQDCHPCLRPNAEGYAPIFARSQARFPLQAPESSMAKRGNSVIGIDLGKRAYKAVLLNKKSETRYALTSFASHEVPEEVTTADEVAQHVKQLLKDLGGSTKSCALAGFDPACFWGFFGQPSTPPSFLAILLRLTGLGFLTRIAKIFCLTWQAFPIKERP